MIFIIPIVLGAAAAVTALTGAATGVGGISNMQKAKKIGEAARDRHQKAATKMQQKFKQTNELAEQYGTLQLEVRQDTIGRFASFIERIGQKASLSDLEFLEGIEGFSPQQLHEYKASALEAQKFLQGGFKAAGAAYAAGQGTIGLVGLFGTASTGTAISGLSGAAAWNATLAFLGGGSLAAGGGGMALGTMVLGGITAGPALMIGGFVLAGQGEKALTQAKHYEAKAKTEIGKLEAFEEFLEQIQKRIQELQTLIHFLDRKAIASLDELEEKPFNLERDLEKFQKAGLLVKALAEILKTPILDDEGKLNSNKLDVKKYYDLFENHKNPEYK